MNTLTLFFEWLIAASARASGLAVAVLIAQALLRHRLPARWRHSLWLPVLIVLLMPAFPESSWSVSAIIHQAPAPVLKPLVIGHGVTLPDPPSFLTPIEKPVLPWRELVCLGWLGGAAGTLLFGLTAFVRTLWRFERSRVPVSDAFQSDLVVLAHEIGLRHVPCVCMSSAIFSPAVTGFLRPTVLLPAGFEHMLAPNEIRLVMKHELMHIKRGDLLLNALLCLLLAMHWFNPLLWLAFIKERLDRETACDAQVLESEDLAQRVAYGHTLLKVESAFSHSGLSVGLVGIFQCGAALRSRIQFIASPPSHDPFMKAILVAGIVFLTFFGITQATTSDPAPKIFIQTKFVEVTVPAPGGSGVAPLPALFDMVRKVPGLVGTINDPQFQEIIRNLAQRKGVDLMSAPGVTARSGQQATVEVLHEFPYKDEVGKPITAHTGVTFTVLAKVRGDGRLDLEMTPKIVEVEGMMNLGLGRQKPVFKERKFTKNVSMSSGQTTVLEMHPTTDKQVVQESDEAGNIISSRTDHYFKRMLVFVTAYRLDPMKGNILVPKHDAEN